jgi:RNA polymerase sigma-70 factor (ECF subfamily)
MDPLDEQACGLTPRTGPAPSPSDLMHNGKLFVMSGLPAERNTEEDLIRQVCKGQTEFFYELIQPYQGTAFAVARSILDNAADAEEVVQESFLKALRGLGKFRGEAKFSTWLIQIVLNEARARLRRDRQHPHRSIDELAENDGGESLPRDPADWREIPSEARARAELRRTIERALRSLRPIYREVLVLRDIQQLNTAQTAEMGVAFRMRNNLLQRKHW